jgi:transcriptional regulator with XRE-family HTH domain
MATFGARLKHWREKRGWSQQDLAKHAGVPYMTIWRAEAQTHHSPRMEIAKRLALALGVSLDVLCGLYEADETTALPATAVPVGT